MKFVSIRLTRVFYALPICLFALCIAASVLKDYTLDIMASAPVNLSIGKKIILDAGHGAFDGGSTSVTGRLEKDINLNIALKTETFLKAFGFEVVLTRSDDSALGGTKKEDMRRRLELARQNPDSLFISIHQNHYGESKYLGAQMFYGKQNSEDSRALALVLQQNFKDNLNPQNTRQAKEAPSDLFLFKNCPIPSVLIECGFLSNYEEARLLENEEYQSKIAFTIAQSVIGYYMKN